MANEVDPGSRQWHLDKRIPIALIVTLIIQSAGAIWWAASVNASLSQLYARTEKFDTFISQGDRFTQRDAERRINPLEQNIAVIKNDIQQIRRLLEEDRK